MHSAPTWVTVLATPTLRLTPVTAHDQAVFWVQMAVLLILAVGLGRLASKIGQPPVVGQLLAGVILGPTVFGQVWRAGFDWFLPNGQLVQSSLLFAVSTLSLAILLLTVGFETDVTLLRRLGRPASWVTAGSLVLPLTAGLTVGFLLPSSARGPSASPLAFSLLVAVAIGASSLPVIAEIVSHLGATRRDFGQITLAAGTVNDALAFVVIALAVAIGSQGAVSQLAKVIFGVLVLGTMGALLAQPLVDRLLRTARRQGPERGSPNSHPSLAVCMVAAMVAAALVQLIGIEGALGAFVAGVILARSRFGDAETFRFVAQLSAAFFAPLYFATAGLEANLVLLRHPEVLLVFSALVVVGFASKFLGSYWGAAIGGLPRMERIALGVGLNGRGTVQVIAGTVGLAAGILDTGTYTAIVAMSLFTSSVTAPLLRRVVHTWEGSPDERRRLALEARLSTQLMVSSERVLLLVDQDRAGADALRLVDRAWPDAAGFTIFTTEAAPEFRDSHPDISPTRSIEWRSLDRSQLAEAVATELKLGYGSMVLATELIQSATGGAEEPLDRLLPTASIPIMLVLRPPGAAEAPVGATGILVSVSGARASLAALEVAYSLAERDGEAVRLLHVDTSPRGLRRLRLDRLRYRRLLRPQRHERAAQAILNQAIEMSAAYGIEPRADILAHPEFEPGLVAEAAKHGLVILGVRLVPTDDGAYFGAAAEALLHNLPDRTVLVALPD
ncbi:MAG: cation:proton antiporter domain-containing protein [Candidatus Dormibacteria bacterium]